MNLDEAIAVYLFLNSRSPGNRDEREEAAFIEAWGVIVKIGYEIVEQFNRGK